MKIQSCINFSLGHARSHTKFWPHRFSRFDVYWKQTNKQTDWDKPNLYIDVDIMLNILESENMSYSTLSAFRFRFGCLFGCLHVCMQ